MEFASVPKEISKRFRSQPKQQMKMLDDLKEQMDGLDPTLHGAMDTARSKIEYQIDKLRSKTGRAEDASKDALMVSREFSGAPAVPA